MSRQAFTVVASDGCTLAGTEHIPVGGVTPGSPTVVLAHGWTLTRESWEPVITQLHEQRKVRVITYDQRGHGKSSMGDVVNPTVRALGHDLDAVIQAMTPTGQIVLGGHSMGGMTIMAYAGQHHGVFQERIRGIVLVSTAASVQGRKPIPLEGFVMRAASRMPALGPGRVIVPTRVQGRMLFGDGARPEDIKHAIRQIQATKMPVIGKYFTALQNHDEVEALAHFIDVPTHILVGTKDILTPPKWSRNLQDAIPGSTLEVFPGLGHMLTYEKTDAVTAALVGMIDRATVAAA
jgi:pimeloyl-ACP methyl ester carboxylesterase